MENQYDDAFVGDGDEIKFTGLDDLKEDEIIEEEKPVQPPPSLMQDDEITDEEDIQTDLNFPELNEDGTRIVCQVCGKDFKAITQSHLKFHGMSPESYKNKFGTPLVTEQQKQHLSVVNKAKFKEIFKEHEDKPPEAEVPIEEVTIDDIMLEEVDDISFDQDIKDIKGPEATQDPLYTRTELAYNIEELMGNITAKENYFIEESSGSGAFPGTTHLKYSFITDIAIPELKVAFFFPDTFWHNRELASDPNKYTKIAEDGWKAIVIKGNSPTMEEVAEQLRKSNLI